MEIRSYLNNLYSEENITDAKKRRELLSGQMFDNEKKGADCLQCTGRCCTFESNSMQMTSIEAVEAIALLEDKGLLTDEVRKRLEDCVDEYRLNHLLQIGPGEYFRRTYTCPFYSFPSFGCGLGVDHKPYGCIAFNPCEPNQKDGGNCQSDLSIQEKRNEIYEAEEERAVAVLLKEKGIDTLKKPIPVKMLEVWDSFSNI